MRKVSVAVAVVLLVAAVCVLLLGLFMKHEGDFAHDYVKAQLDERAIKFTPVEGLVAPGQKDVKCLADHAGEPVDSGKDAECYARYQIGMDLPLVDEGHTYFESHYNGYLSRVAAAEALAKAPDAPETKALVAKAADISRKADDLAAGESMRGLLLTAYGFSVIGERANQGAIVCFILAVVLAVGGVVVFILGRRATPTTASPLL